MQSFIHKNIVNFSVKSYRHILPALHYQSVNLNTCNTRNFHSVKDVRIRLKHDTLLTNRTRDRFLPVSLFGSKQNVRWNGTNVSTPLALPDGYIPEPPLPPIPADSGTQIVEQLTALGEPTLQSLGLCSTWWPPSLFQSGLEAIHVHTQLPWWASIAVVTVSIRLLLFPLFIMAQRNAANVHNHMPIINGLQEKFSKVKQSGNQMEAARVGHELYTYMRKNDVNPMKNVLIPMAQMPVFLSVFIGIRQMANLPVESMTTGGILWFADLTTTDPFFALPIMTCATLLLTIELGVDGVRAASMAPVMRWLMRGMAIAILPITVNFPAAMLCYWFTSNAFSLCLVLLLKAKGMKQFFKIPERVIHDPAILPKRKSAKQQLKSVWKNSKTVVNVQERERQEAIRFREAGMSSIPKTYSYDPTKFKRKDAK